MKYDFFDLLIETDKPNAFKLELRKQLHQGVLIYMQNYGKYQWRTIQEIAEWLLDDKGFAKHGYNFRTNEAWNFFAAFKGLKGEICGSTHYLRKLGYPIIAGSGKKGYRFADENCPDVVEAWEDRLRLWRKQTLRYEVEQKVIDIALLNKVIKKIKNKQKKKQLLLVKNRYLETKRKRKRKNEI